MDWLQKPSPNMGHRTPLEVLSQGDPEDLQKLDDILTSLDYGMQTISRPVSRFLSASKSIFKPRKGANNSNIDSALVVPASLDDVAACESEAWIAW